MILKDGKPYALPKEKVDYLKTFMKDGVVELRISSNLKSIEKGRNERMDPFTREIYPPSVSIPAFASVMEEDGGHEYRYATNQSANAGKTNYYPSSIQISEGGRRVSDLDMLFFLFYCSPFLKGGEAYRNEKKTKPGLEEKMEFYSQDTYDEREMAKEKIITKAKYLVSNEWDRKKLLDVAASMFITFKGDEAMPTIQKAILASISSSTDPMKWEKFLAKSSDDQAQIHASGVNLLVSEGIFAFVPSKRTWIMVKDGFEKEVVSVRPSDMSSPNRVLSEELAKFPGIMAEAQAEYSRILESKARASMGIEGDEAPRVAPKKRYAIDDAAPLGSSSIDEGAEESEDEAEDSLTTSALLDAALEKGVVVRLKGWYRFGSKTLGNSVDKFEEALEKDPEIAEAISIALGK